MKFELHCAGGIQMYVLKKYEFFAFSLARLASGLASCLTTSAASLATGSADIFENFFFRSKAKH